MVEVLSLDHSTSLVSHHLVVHVTKVTLPDKVLNFMHDQSDNNHKSYNSIPLSTGDYSIKSLKCWYTNADSLLNKLDELKCRMMGSYPDIVCITKVFPKHCVNEVSIVNLHIDSYNCHCSSFSHSNHGVCMYMKSNLNVYRLEDLCANEFQESLWYSVSLPNSDNVTVGIVYHSPNSAADNNNKLFNLIKDATRVYSSNLIIIGDFNFLNIDWHSWT